MNEATRQYVVTVREKWQTQFLVDAVSASQAKLAVASELTRDPPDPPDYYRETVDGSRSIQQTVMCAWRDDE